MEVIPIVVALALLVVLVFMRVSILIAAPVAAFVMALLSGMPLLDSMIGPYMQGFSGFAKNNYMIFLTGALFGKIMEDSGAAASIAKFIGGILGPKRAIWAVMLGCAFLTYGGVSLFVVVFAMYPVALSLFKEANLPRALIPASIAAGSFTVTAAIFPGTPQIPNMIPTTYLGTDAMAAPMVGVAAGLFVCAAVYVYFSRVIKVAQSKSVGFVEGPGDNEKLDKMASMQTPHILLAILPVLVITFFLNVMRLHIVIAMTAGVLTCFLLFYKRLPNILNTINYGVDGSVIAIVNTAAAVGVGSVTQASPGFEVLINLVTSFEGNPLFALAAATSLLAGATGSAGGGLGIALQALAPDYLAMGISPELIHRVSAIACLGLDSLPFNGAIVTLLTVTGVSHKDGYKYIFWPTVVFTTLSVIVAIVVGSLIY